MIKPCYGKCDYCGATQIDREALLHDIEQSVVYTAREKITSAEMRGAHKIIERIKCAPAVEPIYIHEPTKSEFKRMAVQMGYVQVVHGQWEWFDEDTGTPITGYEREWGWRCSRCKHELPDDYDDPDYRPMLDYCPYCGAIMDGGANNG